VRTASHVSGPGALTTPLPGVPRQAWRRLLEGAVARLRCRTLDRRLAAGADALCAPLLARRAAQLARPGLRQATAQGIERALGDARHPYRRAFSSAVPVCRDEVLIAEPALVALVARLRDGRPIRPAGIARVRAALTDPSGPLYVGGTPGGLREWARSTLLELDDGLA
jgi:hypothetical protein